MTGDCHAGICGSLGVKFPQATRPMITCHSVHHIRSGAMVHL